MPPNRTKVELKQTKFTYLLRIMYFTVSCNTLTCREKEEDLEKKQFFINRELRPLMEIPGQLLSD